MWNAVFISRAESMEITLRAGLWRLHGILKRMGEAWEVLHDGLPNDVEVDLEVAMGHGIPHLIGRTERYLRMQCREIRESSSDAMACFSDDLEISDDGVLDESISHEQSVIQAMRISADTSDCGEDVLDVAI